MTDSAFLTAKEFAREIGVSRSTVHTLISQKRIPAARVGGSVRIPRSFLNSLEEGSYEGLLNIGRKVRGKGLMHYL